MTGSKFLERMKKLKMKHFLVLFFVFIIFFGAVYGIYNYRQERIKPVDIKITSPQEEKSVYQSEKIIVEGITKENTKIIINGTVSKSDDEGRFYLEVPLQIGANEIKIDVAEGREKSTKKIIVIREEPYFPEVVKEEIEVEEVSSSRELNQTGPENLWLFEIMLISGSFLIYLKTRKRLKNSRK